MLDPQCDSQQPDNQQAHSTSAQHNQNKIFSRRNLLKKGAAATGTLTVASGGITALEGLRLPTYAASHRARIDGVSRGQLREYWFQADSFLHNFVPTGLDGMMGTTFTPAETSLWMIGYRAYTPGWHNPLAGNDDIGANTGIPGPIIRANVGDTVRVHFRNNDVHYKFPHSIHTHGLLYSSENDGAWTFLDPDKPGTAVPFGQSFTYEWQVVNSSVGTWLYHDHSKPFGVPGGPVLMELGAELGLFGMFAITDASTPHVDQEIALFFHDLYAADLPKLQQDFDLFNGFAFLGNTPTYHVRRGQRVRWRVATLGREFHVFHLHGHRWSFNGRFDDALVFGPSTTLTFDYIEDNPGKWLYHCHVLDHMMGGMVGYYISEP